MGVSFNCECKITAFWGYQRKQFSKKIWQKVTFSCIFQKKAVFLQSKSPQCSLFYDRNGAIRTVG